MFVKPAAGRMIRWPGTLVLLSDDGENVSNTAFWRRCLERGDVIEIRTSSSSIPSLPQSKNKTETEETKK